MDSQKIAGFIIKAKHRLQLQYMIKMLQIALSFGLASVFLVMLISRLSVFLYFEFYAYSAFALTILSIMLLGIRKIPRRIEAIAELDQFTPHNQLLTLTQIPIENQLVKDLVKQTEKEIDQSYQLIKKERKDWLSPKWLLISLSLAILLLISGLFPASTQLAAKDKEQQQELVEDMIDKVEKHKEQTDLPTVIKELDNLEKKLIESETPEQALRELVKKQKELAMKQQQKKKINSDQAKKEAEAFEQASAQLAKQAGDTQTALSEMGKPVAFDLQQSIAANSLTGDPKEASESELEKESENSKSRSSELESAGEDQQSNDSSSENTGSSGDAESGGEGSKQADGDGEDNSQSEESDGETESEGEAGSSDGQGSDQGQSVGPGTGAGTGQGSRELLSIPSRIGGTGETTIDEGELTEGEPGSFTEGFVDTERGSVRPYQDVVGSYRDSYFSSADRLKLPPDLQKIVEQYFSAIESD